MNNHEGADSIAVVVDGKKLAAEIRREVTAQALNLKRRPELAVILVGEDPASQLYVRNKANDCMECGFIGRRYDLPESTSQSELLELIGKLNDDDAVDGILVQLPLPKHICDSEIISAIDPQKDVDGFHPVNVGRMVAGDPVVWPCTPSGIMEILKSCGVSPDGKVCVVVGRSNIVGKPMGLLLLRSNGTVIFCHRRTPDLKKMTLQADILVVATGNRDLITGDMVKEGATVIDVAMNRDPVSGKFSGDVVFDEAEKKAAYITPVPGGVGPMTRAMLMRNIYILSKMHQEKI